MATMMASAAVAPPYGLAGFASLSAGRLSRRSGGRACAVAKASLSSDSQSTRPLPSQQMVFQDRLLSGAQSWRERIADTELGKFVAPIAASAGFYWQASASALEDVVKVEDRPSDLTVILVTSGIYAVLYFLVIPAVVYNYLRLRWYKRKAAETVFQFALVFVFFPGMLLLAPFINFRRLPKEGTEPP